MKVVMCQLNTWVGDITGNTAKVLASVAVESEPDASHLFVFPELTLTGYPPEDLLLRPALAEHIDKAMPTRQGASQSLEWASRLWGGGGGH